MAYSRKGALQPKSSVCFVTLNIGSHISWTSAVRRVLHVPEVGTVPQCCMAAHATVLVSLRACTSTNPRTHQCHFAQIGPHVDDRTNQKPSRAAAVDRHLIRSRPLL